MLPKPRRSRPGFTSFQLLAVTLASVGIGGYLLFGVFKTFSGDMGAQAAAEASQRLALIWPDVMTWPEDRRAFVAGLSMTCRLHRREATRPEAVACLESAAANPDAILPEGVAHENADAILAQLLSQSPTAERSL